MGIALLAFSSLSQPVKALTQFFARPGRGASPDDVLPSSHARPTAGLAYHKPPASPFKTMAAAAPALASPAPTSFSAGLVAPATARPPMGTVPSVSTGPMRQVQATLWATEAPATPVQAANADRFYTGAGGHQPGSALKKERPLLRVMRRIHATDPARLVISGRMADVCAELDRLAASEAALAV